MPEQPPEPSNSHRPLSIRDTVALECLKGLLANSRTEAQNADAGRYVNSSLIYADEFLRRR